MWGVDAFGLPFHDNWWQTETGGIMIANFAALDIKPGSMGVPLPGIEAAILRHDEGKDVTVIEEPMVEGELALKVGWPYDDARATSTRRSRYRKCFSGGVVSDWRSRQAGRGWLFPGSSGAPMMSIKSAGHLIGPFEVESALMEHPGRRRGRRDRKPDPTAGEIVKAFVALKPGHETLRGLAQGTPRPCP